jgi:hypothetical protein
MQQQLLDVSDIPPQIQSKMAMLTKALEQFMTMDGDALQAAYEQDASSSSVEREVSGGEVDEEEEKRFSAIEEENEDIDDDEECENFEALSSTREMSYSFEDLIHDGNDDDDDERNFEHYEECEDKEEFSGDEETEELTTEEQMQLAVERKKKNEKIETLQKSWQKLCENQKTIHK